MQNQHQLWNQVHATEEILTEATEFSQEILQLCSPSSKILELGCGAGTDAVAFAQAGHTVTATDFSEVVIAKNTQKYHFIPNLNFQVVDLNHTLPFKPASFDVVYARLSLHYFPTLVTQRIFNDIHSILKSGGHFGFMCKSINDSYFGQGIQIEPNMFEREGHVRHFFSRVWVEQLLADKFEIINLSEHEDVLYKKKSAFIKVIASKI